MVAVATGVSARRRLRLALAGISLAYFMVLLDTTVLAVAEPDLIATLDTDAIGVGGATTAYTMALAAALVFGGNLADRLGPQRVFLVGSGGFGLVSLACAAAPVSARCCWAVSGWGCWRPRSSRARWPCSRSTSPTPLPGPGRSASGRR